VSSTGVPPAPFRVTVPGLLGTLALAVVIAGCVRLGFWQLERLEQRRERNAALASRLDAPVVMLSAGLGDTTGLRFRRGAATGTYDGPRSIVLPGRSLRGLPGVHLLTPLVFDGGGAAVLVNRGWVPSADGATIDESFFQGGEAGRPTGVLLAFPGAESALSARALPPEGTGFRRVWFAIDEAMLRQQFPYRLLDVQLQLLPEAGAQGFPVRLPPPPLDEGPHLGYALQWFSFAIVGVVGWIALVLRSRSDAAARARHARTGDAPA
jgi:surfeit locus 1 family protein